MLNLCRTATVAACLVLPLTCAKAALITDHVTVSLTPSAFTIFSGPTLAAPVTLSFDLTFNPTATTPDTFTGFSDVSYNFSVASSLGYEVTSPTAPSLPGTLIVGGASDGVDQVLFGTDDFYLHITNIATNPTFQQFGLTTSSGSYYFTPTDPTTSASTATGVTFDVSPATVSAVPLPATLPMFAATLLGLAGYGAFRRKRLSGSAPEVTSKA